jgi:cell division protein FtsB
MADQHLSREDILGAKAAEAAILRCEAVVKRREASDLDQRADAIEAECQSTTERPVPPVT